MEITVSDEEMNELLQATLVEMMRKNRDEFLELVIKTMEKIGVANAIREGRKNKFVSEERIRKILEGE